MTRGLYYILDGKTPVPAPSLEAWGAWFEAADRRVRLTRVGPYMVSTVFLGLDHNLFGDAPLLFETMVYCEGVPGEARGLSWLDHQERCATWEQAELQHEAMIAAVREPGDAVEDADEPFGHVCPEVYREIVEGETREPWRYKVVGLLNSGWAEFDVKWEPPADGEKGSN